MYTHWWGPKPTTSLGTTLRHVSNWAGSFCSSWIRLCHTFRSQILCPNQLKKFTLWRSRKAGNLQNFWSLWWVNHIYNHISMIINGWLNRCRLWFPKGYYQPMGLRKSVVSKRGSKMTISRGNRIFKKQPLKKQDKKRKPMNFHGIFWHGFRKKNGNTMKHMENHLD